MESERDQVRSLLSLCVVDTVGKVPETEEDENQWIAARDDVSGKELRPEWGQSSKES